MDGAMSTSDGFCPRIGRLHHITPGTSSASAQWSALHAARFSETSSGSTSPRQVAQDARNPRWYPTIKSGASAVAPP